MRRSQTVESPPVVRCAVYTRVSTAEQAEGDYSSLDSQRETGEAYIASQKHAGWKCLPDRYDDGGFTGANTDRPAFQRLLADIATGRVDCIVCYKLDRLTRSLVDFARTLEVLDNYGVALVSVTQAFDTSTATGKLMMHILMSFAEFERQLISERTRDKIAAARRRGKWSGGMPVLGYNVVDTKLVVDPDEAEQVRQIFNMYLEHRSLTKLADELGRRAWRTKEWTTKNGLPRGGRTFTKTTLYQLLTNPVYVGNVRYKSEVHAGEHEAIVDKSVFDKVQQQLASNGAHGGHAVRNKYGALLTGLVHCAHCRCAMSHHYTTKGNRRYRYYVCTNAQKRGRQHCPGPSIPAGELERFVVDQIRDIGRDPELVRETAAVLQRHVTTENERLTKEQGTLRRQLAARQKQLAQLASAELPNELRLARLAEVQEQARATHQRLAEIGRELSALETENVEAAEVATVLAQFDDVWKALKPREQVRLIELLVASVVWDATQETVSVTFHDTRLQALKLQPKESAA